MTLYLLTLSDSRMRLILLSALLISLLKISVPELDLMAQTNEGFVTVLIDDAIQNLQNNETSAALTHLNLAQQGLETFANESSSVNVATVLIDDAIQNLQNNETSAALTHLNLANQQLEGMNITASTLSLGKEDVDIAVKPTE